MKAEVLKSCTVNNVPKNPGDIVEVDDNVFKNMEVQGLLKAHKNVDKAASDASKPKPHHGRAA